MLSKWLRCRLVNLLIDIGILDNDNDKINLVNKLNNKIGVVKSEGESSGLYGAIKINSNIQNNNLDEQPDDTILVYPMYEKYKVLFKRYIIFFNTYNPLIELVDSQGKVIMHGMCELEFHKKWMTLQNISKEFKLKIKSDGTQRVIKNCLSVENRIKQINKKIKRRGIVISNLPKHPKWMTNTNDIFIDEITDDLCSKSYFNEIHTEGELNNVEVARI